MSKKKTPAKKAKKTPRVWKSPKGAARATQATKRAAVPRDVPLFPETRIKSLDKLCEQISDTRAAVNRLRGDETDLERHAHKEMQAHQVMNYSAAGVELSRVPGDEKLRVRTSKETSTTQADVDEMADGGDE